MPDFRLDAVKVGVLVHVGRRADAIHEGSYLGRGVIKAHLQMVDWLDDERHPLRLGPLRDASQGGILRQAIGNVFPLLGKKL